MRRRLAGMMIWMGLAGALSVAGEPAGRTIVTTFYPIQIAVLNLTAGVEGVRVVNLAAPSIGCLHDYQLTPRDRAVLSRADLVVANGAGMESFLGDLARLSPAPRLLDASSGIELLVKGAATNSHVWLSPARHIQQVRTIGEGLAAWDPSHAGIYRDNARRYEGELKALRARIARELAGIKTRDIITFHEAFPYFAEEFGLRVVAVIEREPGTDPSAGELAALIRQVRESGVKTLFVEPQYPAKAVETIARETGASLFTLDPVVSGPVSPQSYLDLMDQNLHILIRALK